MPVLVIDFDMLIELLPHFVCINKRVEHKPQRVPSSMTVKPTEKYVLIPSVTIITHNFCIVSYHIESYLQNIGEHILRASSKAFQIDQPK